MGVLRPEKMAKVGLLGLKDDEERILTLLHDLRLAQIEPLSPEAIAELSPERATELQRVVADEALRFRGLVSVLPGIGEPRPARFESPRDLLTAAQAVPIDAEVGDLKREEDRLQTELKGIDETLDLLQKIAFYPDRLEYLRSSNFLAFYGEAEPDSYAALRAALPVEADAQFLMARPEEMTRFLVVLRTAGAESLSRVAQANGIRLTAIPPLAATAHEEATSLAARHAEIVTRRKGIAERLTATAREWYPTVAAIDEALTIQNRTYEVYSKLGAGRDVFALEAWVPARDVPRLRSVVETATAGRVHFYAPPTREEPPTFLQNPTGIRRFEFFIRFYSLPQASEWDPTLVFAIVFPIFFGIMLGDWGYGLTILLICVWMIRGFPGANHLPKAGRNFVKMIMGPRGMQQLAWALLPGCGLAIALGLVFDEFFGVNLAHLLFHITPIADPLHEVGPLLLIAGYVGLGMVTFGFLLGALKEYFHRHRRGVIGKVGGIAFAWGVVGFGLQVIHYHTITALPFTPILAASLAGLGLGVVLLVAGEGIQTGIMGLIEIVSHILSYTRLIGILLASVVLAVVINKVAILAAHSSLGPILGIAVAVIVILIGQSFNVIIGVFEPGIQGARLIFVEYFSKFYTGNGKPFHPFGAPRKHTVSSIGPDGLASGPLVQAPEG